MRREDLKSEILRMLLENQAYGYEIAKRSSEEKGRVHTGYLYGVLNEMEKEGLVESEWEKGITGPPRKIYKITSAGKESLQLGLILKAKRGYPQSFTHVRTAALLALLALVVTNIAQYTIGGSLGGLNITAGTAALVFASTLTFISLRRSGSWVAWLVSAIAFLMAISVLFPPHPSHTWQGVTGLALAIIGVAKLSIGLALLGFALMMGSFVFHEFALQIDEGLLHDVYTSSTWLAIFAAALGVNAVYLYLVRGRIAGLGELLSFGKSPSLPGLESVEQSRIIKAPKEKVWQVLTDMENWPKWLNSETGFRVVSHNIVSAQGNVIVCDEITEVDGRKILSRDKYTLYPEEKIEETFLEGPVRGRLVFTIQPTSGGTKVGILTEMKFKGSIWLGSLLRGRESHKQIQTGFLNALAKAVET